MLSPRTVAYFARLPATAPGQFRGNALDQAPALALAQGSGATLGRVYWDKSKMAWMDVTSEQATAPCPARAAFFGAGWDDSVELEATPAVGPLSVLVPARPNPNQYLFESNDSYVLPRASVARGEAIPLAFFDSASGRWSIPSSPSASASVTPTLSPSSSTTSSLSELPIAADDVAEAAVASFESDCSSEWSDGLLDALEAVADQVNRLAKPRPAEPVVWFGKMTIGLGIDF